MGSKEFTIVFILSVFIFSIYGIYWVIKQITLFYLEISKIEKMMLNGEDMKKVFEAIILINKK